MLILCICAEGNVFLKQTKVRKGSSVSVFSSVNMYLMITNAILLLECFISQLIGCSLANGESCCYAPWGEGGCCSNVLEPGTWNMYSKGSHRMTRSESKTGYLELPHTQVINTKLGPSLLKGVGVYVCECV